MDFGVLGDPLVGSGGAEKHPGPFWPLSVKTPPSGGVSQIGHLLEQAFYQGQSGPDKTPTSAGVLS